MRGRVIGLLFVAEFPAESYGGFAAVRPVARLPFVKQRTYDLSASTKRRQKGGHVGTPGFRKAPGGSSMMRRLFALIAVALLVGCAPAQTPSSSTGGAATNTEKRAAAQTIRYSQS